MNNNKIIFFTKYSRKGASSRLRFFQFEQNYKKLGVDIEYSELFDDFYIDSIYSKRKVSIIYILSRYIKRLTKIFTLKRDDTIWIQAELFPYLPSLFEMILGKLGFRLISEYDDAIFHNYDDNILLKNKISKVMKYSSAVIVGNDYLYQYAKNSGNKSVYKIPTVINLDKYKQAVNNTGEYHNDKITIGWIGTPNTQGNLELIKKLDDNLVLSRTIKFKLIGAKESPFKNIETELVKWSHSTEAFELSTIDIGIMPLYNKPFELGKCSYKLIQYMALSKPVLASPVGMNKDVVVNGCNGYLCDSFNDWEKNILALVFDSDLREEMGRNSFSILEKEYTTDIAFTKLVSVLSRK